MLFRVIIVTLGVVCAVSADLNTVTDKMRKTVEWLNENTEYDKNSTIILAVGGGSLITQYETGIDTIETQVQAAYLDLIIGLAREKNADTDPEARLYFTAKQFEFVGNFTSSRSVKNRPVKKSPTIYKIYQINQDNNLYKKCLNEFYATNRKVNNVSRACKISTKCTDAMLNPKSKMGALLRNRFMMVAEKLHKCNNFTPNYESIVKGQMQQLNDDINTFLKYIADHEGKLDSRLRYTFLRMIIMMAANGYNVITPTIEAYVDSLSNSEGYCGVGADILQDKVMLSSQCYAIWAFKRQVLLDKEPEEKEEEVEP